MPGVKPNVTRAAMAGENAQAVMGAGAAGDAMSGPIVAIGQKVAARLARMPGATSAVNAALMRVVTKHVEVKHAVSRVGKHAVSCVGKHVASSAVTYVATCAVNNAASRTSKARTSAKRAHHASRVRRVSLETAAGLSAHARGAVIARNAASAQQSSAQQQMLPSRTLQRPTGLPWQQPRVEWRQTPGRKHRAVSALSGVVSGVVAMNAVMSRVQICAGIVRMSDKVSARLKHKVSKKVSARTFLMPHL